MKLKLDASDVIPKFDAELRIREGLKQVKAELLRLQVNINMDAVGLPGTHDTVGYCIHYENDFWLVYYSKEGRRSRLAVFEYLSDAADYFVWLHVASYGGGNTDVRHGISDMRLDSKTDVGNGNFLAKLKAIFFAPVPDHARGGD